jgi:hypothetical protein
MQKLSVQTKAGHIIQLIQHILMKAFQIHFAHAAVQACIILMHGMPYLV